MDHGMDDPVLRSLSADLQRDDPRLAALLSGRGLPHDRPATWLRVAVPLVGLVLLTAGLLLPLRVTLGVSSMLLILVSPLAACWLCAAADRADGEPPHRP
jgi:hypothetical protein